MDEWTGSAWLTPGSGVAAVLIQGTPGVAFGEFGRKTHSGLPPAVPHGRDGRCGWREGLVLATKKPVGCCDSTSTGFRRGGKTAEEKEEGVKTPLSRELDAFEFVGVPKGI